MNDERIKSVIAMMTLDEKIALLSTELDGKTFAIDRLKVESITLPLSPLEESFVSPSVVACSFDATLAESAGCLEGANAIKGKSAFGSVLSPSPVRDVTVPDSFGEDAYHVYKMATAVAKGCNKSGLPVVIRDLYGQSQATIEDRWIDKKSLMEQYLFPSIRLCEEAKVAVAVIPGGTYNDELVANTRWIQSHLTSSGEKIIFAAVIGGIESRVDAFRNGTLVEYGTRENSFVLAETIVKGLISESYLDTQLIPLLQHVVRSNTLYKKPPVLNIDREFVNKLYDESIVMLNNDMDFFPLARGKQILLVGGDYISRSLAKELSDRGVLVNFVDSSGSIDKVTKKVAKIVGDNIDIPIIVPCACEYGASSVPGATAQVIKTLVGLSSNVGVILLSTSYVSFRYCHCVRGMLFCPHNNMHAVANILTGDTNPSGKLPFTWAKDFNSYPRFAKPQLLAKAMVAYEGNRVGNRFFAQYPKLVQYPFGYGLSYTEFSHSSLKATLVEGGIEVSFVLKNIGRAAGSAVSQIYLTNKNSISSAPRRLVYYTKNFLSKSENIPLKAFIPYRDIEVYDTESNKYVVEEGKYILSVAFHALDIGQCATIDIRNGVKVASEVVANELVGYTQVTEEFSPSDPEIETLLGASMSRLTASSMLWHNANYVASDIVAAQGIKKLLTLVTKKLKNSKLAVRMSQNSYNELIARQTYKIRNMTPKQLKLLSK